MKLGTRLLIFSSAFLVLLPWFAYKFIGEIERSLLQGQEEAQSMAASAMATVLSGYSEVFDIDENALYVYPISHSIAIDGYDEDWGELQQRFTPFADGRFSLLLANGTTDKSEQYLYLYVKVSDDNIIYRNPRYYSLDSSDHIRLEYEGVDNKRHRLVLLAEGRGNITAYTANEDWTTWQDVKPVNSIDGVFREIENGGETGGGYIVELRLPRKWLEPARRFSLSVVDVYSENERSPEKIVSTHSLDNVTLNPLLFQSGEISGVLTNLAESDSRICVVDRYRRVRAVTGGHKLQASFCQSIDKVSADLVNKVLRTKNNNVAQVERITENDETLIVAARPVYGDDKEIVGAVLVSKNSRQILSLQRDTLNNVMLATLAIFLLVILSLLFFSSWLAFRINRLKTQISSVVDDSGRFVATADLSDVNSGDEIGELSRSFSALLQKLNSYTRFLESVPRMLRHEILNPVNTISMSLQNRQQHDDHADLQIANNAVRQLQLIVSSLTEAANIDDALANDEIEVFDIAALLTEYAGNLQTKHRDALLRYQGDSQGVMIAGNDIRLVQLLDKIKDNALDFSFPNTEIVFYLEVELKGQEEYAVIRLTNEGERIPQSQLDVLFQGMVSQRPDNTGAPHLGIGLYVAYNIALFHSGRLHIANRGDKQGVEVVLKLPIVK